MSCHNSTDTSLETRVFGFWTACNLWKRECTVSSPYINPQRVEAQIDQSVKSRTKTIVWKIKAHLGGHSSSPERVVWFTTFELLIRAPDDSCTYEKSFTGLRTVSDLSAQVYIVLLIHAEQAELYIKKWSVLCYCMACKGDHDKTYLHTSIHNKGWQQRQISIT